MVACDTKFKEWLIGIRREIHQNPELGFNEHITTTLIKALLTELGVETKTFDSMTGLVGLIKGDNPNGPTIALRADIDALPITELVNTPYRSKNDGVMHACGHDANTTIMLGVAKKIIESGLRKKMRGNVKFLFQPAEEIGQGAKAMIDNGVLENPQVDRIIAGHMSPDIKAGQIGVFKDIGYAAMDIFTLKITGKGGHGGRPEETLDPIVAGSHFVTQVQTIIGRNIKPSETAVVTVGRFVSGTKSNVIPESAVLEGNIRTFSKQVRTQVISRLEEFIKGLEVAFHMNCQFTLRSGTDVLINDSETSELLFQAATQSIGSANVSYIPPITGSEDFSFFCQERPSSIIRIGCSNSERGVNSPLHSPYFDIDEDVLEIGANVFFEAVKQFFS